MLRTAIHEFELELDIIQELTQVRACTFDELCMRIPWRYSWDEVFSAVERLRREGSVSLLRARSFDSLISVTPRQPTKIHHLRIG